MRLVFRGHRRARVQRVPLEEVRASCPSGHMDTGCFRHHGTWSQEGNTVTVDFNPTIYLNQDLDAAASREAEAHERRHYTDFRARANVLHNALVRASHSSADPDMRARWEWFLYDICRDEYQFHHEIGTRVPICQEPGGTRP